MEARRIIHSKKGYKLLLQERGIPLRSSQWKAIWNSETLSKVKSFVWTWAHGKILTANNLENKRHSRTNKVFPLQTN